MKRYTFLIILVSTCGICNSQNFFSNPDFELFTNCPVVNGELNKTVDWIKVIEDADYINCTYTGWATQQVTGAQSGTGYVGFASYQSVAYATEAIGQVLTTPLNMGNNYSIQFYAKKAFQGTYSSVCNGVCFYGWVGNPVAGGTQQGICPLNLSGAYMLGCTDTIIDPLWKPYQVIFSAPANLDFIAIAVGCSNLCGEYVYLDNISLTDYTGLNETGSNKEIKISPNPFSSKLNISTSSREPSEIILYDISSRKLLQQEFSNSISLNTEQLAKGLYLYEVQSKDGLCKKGKVVKD